MATGMIVKALAGFYYVLGDNQQEYQCRARGVFKKKGISPLVGDRVEYSPVGSTEGVIEDVLPRRVELVRPPIANVDQALLVFSVRKPELNRRLLDRLLVHIERAHLRAFIILTKMDLLENTEQIASDIAPYLKMGYPVMQVAAKQQAGVDEVRNLLHGRVSVLAGQSGVGKSSLLNALYPDLNLKMGEVSQKLGRGKHTTRHVELISVELDSFIADTPGFSQLEFGSMEPEELDQYFREINEFSKHCYYRGCLHTAEHDCAVIDAVQHGQIDQLRYEHYLGFLNELREAKQNRY